MASRFDIKLFIAFIFLIAPLLFASSVFAKIGQDEKSSDMVNNLANFRFDKLGNPQIKSDSIKPALASKKRPQNLLIIPVRFSNTGYDRFAGEISQDKNNREYFQDLLFAGGVDNPREGTLSHYYNHQSRGLYNITGNIFQTLTLEKPLSYYGRPNQSSDGSWRNDKRATELVIDTLKAAYASNPEFPWSDYDLWDPNDFDNDGNRDEPDGYIDHFILIVAGKGQASCQSFYKLNEKFNVNAKADVFDTLTKAEQGCADRLWPHRFSLSQNLGKGPTINNVTNDRGGIDIGNGLWVLDYNMQSEYTEVSTFIHEFGHSLGLPDVYASQTSNSTASWEVMSATSSPEPQEMSAWSRMVLGWMKPCVIRPTNAGGKTNGSFYLKTMNDWSGDADKATCDATMVILPPKFRDLDLAPMGGDQGKLAIYSGQGNDMNKTFSRSFDLRNFKTSDEIILSMDLWFVIEAEWDYLYLEVAKNGEDFTRIMPTDKSSVSDKSSVMPSTKGHEGDGFTPGFTGRSGDLDGDGKVEIAKGCNPNKDRALAEDNIGKSTIDPCENSQWVNAQFNLSKYAGNDITLRFSYFADAASVEDGAMIDNIKIPAIKFEENFESGNIDKWNNRGFSLSTGKHHLSVPHFYILEWRDPYETFSKVKNYDNNLSYPGFSFYPNQSGELVTSSIKYRSGLLMWYFNGEYLWSQNDPAQFGPGHGFLLLVDSTPQEFKLDMLPEKYYKNTDGWTHWELDNSAQAELHESYVSLMCNQRRRDYYSSDVSDADRKRCSTTLTDGVPEIESYQWEGRQLTYGFTIINEYLPGPERRKRKGVGNMFDYRIQDGKTIYRLNDRSLRNRHSADAPFSVEPFENGIEHYELKNGELSFISATPYSSVNSFSDSHSNRYQNPKLPFGGVDIPELGFSYSLKSVDKSAPKGSKIKIEYNWKK